MLDYQLNNSILLEKVNRYRREEMIRDALRSRMVNKSGIMRLTLMDQLLMHLGGVFIKLGQKLQERCLLSMPQGAKPHPSKY